MEKIVPVFGDMMGCRPLSLEELQELVRIEHQQAPAPYSYQSLLFKPQQVPDSFSFGADNIGQLVPVLDVNEDESLKYFSGHSQWSDGLNGLSEDFLERSEPIWQRIKWSDEMVKVLITAASYVGEDALTDFPKNEKGMLLAPVKGKWKAISSAMIERGYIVSPQQCEDKFNDLNRKYRRVNHILGSNSFDVVANPTLLESMDIPNDAKEEMKKILACKQLFYKEMSSYHNWDRTHLPHDRLLQESIQSALKGKVKYGSENMVLELPAKRQKLGEDNGVSSRDDTPLCAYEVADLIGAEELNQWMISRSLQLEERKLLIQKQKLELEKEKFEWLKFRQQQDMNLQKLKLENELIKLETERLEFELKRAKMGANRN